jgi:hypothetical protein
MADITCATCPFGERLDTGATDNMVCHLGRFSDEPRHPSTWFCSEHPLAPGQRDRIAEMVMQAQIANSGWMNSHDGWSEESIAKNSYEQADAMMAERAKKKE